MAKKIIGYADFETEHQLDILNKTGMYVGKAGNTVHLFRDAELKDDTGVVPESRVKCGGLIVGDDEVIVHSVTEMLTELYQRKVSTCYFHNLAFDEYYFAYVFMENGNLIQVAKNRYARCKSRSIGFQGQMYSSSIEFINGNGKHVRDCKLKDSAKIWAQRLEKLGELIGVPKGHEALRAGCDEVLEEYCLQDCRILKAVMEMYFQIVSETTEGKFSGWLTSASTAYNMGKWWVTEHGDLSDKEWDTMFPATTEENGFPVWLREGYKGATPLLNPAIKGKIINGVSVFDINSDYPYQMCTQRMPMGKPVNLTGKIDDDEFWKLHDNGVLLIVKAQLRADVKKGHRATFLLKHKNDEGTTLADHIDTEEPGQDEYHVMTSVDLDILIRDYDIHYFHAEEILAFDSPHHKVNGSIEYYNVFEPFLRYWYDVKTKYKQIDKQNGTTEHAPMIAFAKLIINSFYGKFGTNPVFEGKDYELEEAGAPLKLVDCGEAEVDDNPKYLPFAMFATSYGRDLLSRVCNLMGWENVAYTDTDSVHVFNMSGKEARAKLIEAGYVCDGTTLGGWDMEEEDCPMALYIRPKGYVHADEQGVPYQVKMAGANDFSSMSTIYDFMKPEAYAVKKTGYKVIGGKLICEARINVNDLDNGMKQRIRIRNGRTIAGEHDMREYQMNAIRRATELTEE